MKKGGNIVTEAVAPPSSAICGPLTKLTLTALSCIENVRLTSTTPIKMFTLLTMKLLLKRGLRRLVLFYKKTPVNGSEALLMTILVELGLL